MNEHYPVPPVVFPQLHSEQPMVEDKPRWTHDCENCKFLGSIRINQWYDVYACPMGRLEGTLLARYGDDGPEYCSFDTRVFQMMVVSSFRTMVYGTGQISQDIPPWMQAVLVCVLQKAVS